MKYEIAQHTVVVVATVQIQIQKIVTKFIHVPSPG